MLRVYTCIVHEHDLRLVVLAAIVCSLASFTAINLVHHVRRSTGQMRRVWLCVAATASGFGIGAAATRVGLIEGARKWKIYGALLLTTAICSHHFTAMGAASIMPDPRIVVPETAIPTGWLAVAVALASLAILLLACCGLALDI